MVNALGQTTTYNSYDGNGRLLSMTDPLGLTTTYSYDKLGPMLTKSSRIPRPGFQTIG
jgi:YD repeat-containing protein